MSYKFISKNQQIKYGYDYKIQCDWFNENEQKLVEKNFYDPLGFLNSTLFFWIKFTLKLNTLNRK